jgi:chromosome segregation ATPase
VATLEDAAEELVVRLKGLDSEIEESQNTLEALRGQVEDTSKAVEQEWSALTGSAGALLEKLRGEQEQLEAEGREALQATVDARGSVQERGAEARTEISKGQADLEALSQHATALDSGIESLVSDAGEAPAHSLAERAQAVEQELGRVLDESRDFLQDEVVTALGQLAEEVRERCQALRAALTDAAPAALQIVFDGWEAKVDELEKYVATQGFVASHSHARAIVEWAFDECRAACKTHVESVAALVEETVRPLQELAAEVQAAGDALVGVGGELAGALDDTRDAAVKAHCALDAVKGLLASYSFMTP